LLLNQKRVRKFTWLDPIQCTIFNRVQFSLKTRVQYYVIYNGQKKKDNHWSTKHYTENYHFPHSDIFFHRKQKSSLDNKWSKKKTRVQFYVIRHQMKYKKTRTCNFTLQLQVLVTENYHFPHSDIFFHRKQKSDFYFLDIKKNQ
jgi:hypothetical protein